MMMDGAQEAREARKKGGRPPSSLTMRRSVPLRVWTSHGERNLIAAKAEYAHLSVAEFMRRAALGKPVEVVDVPPINTETRRELAAIGHQLNRIVRAVEGGDAVPSDLLDLLTSLRVQADALAQQMLTGVPPLTPSKSL